MSRAVLLDALGTLLELEPPAPLLRQGLADRFDVSISDAEAEHAVAAEIAFYRRHFDQGRDEQSLALLRERCAHVLREALPSRARSTLPEAGELVDVLMSSLRFRSYPEVQDVLAALRSRGMRLIVVSNWDVSLHDRLRELDLTPALDGVVTSAQVGARKPAPRIFEAALQLAGVSAGEAVHVGDSLDEDVGGARAARIEPVLLSRDGIRRPDDVRSIANLAELLG